MGYSVLILDDDVDFNSLLTDIFEQADYIVTSMTDPLEAVDVFRDTDYDLVVTDHKMPEMTGVEFMKVIKQINSDVPVIMVSGYLENDTIRELIREGVGGVFLKPLNIFSLLERTAELIEEAKKLESVSDRGSWEADEGVGTALGFSFRSFPCKSGASAAFAERLYSLRNFKSTLSLIGEPGMQFHRICEDIHGFYESNKDYFVYFCVDSFDEHQALTLLELAKQQGAERVTCVLLALEQMDDVQKKLAIQLAKREGVFKSHDVALRTLFCVSGDLDSLFDEAVIDENLYILMGTAEVTVPSLNECQADVDVMAQQIVVELAREKGLAIVPCFERSARDLLRQHKWVNNFDELYETMDRILSGEIDDVITHAAVKSALKLPERGSPRISFETYLSSQQVDYLRAAAIFFGGNRSLTANFFDTDVVSIEAKIH
jgi:DNA-binding NtrC family response regulator